MKPLLFMLSAFFLFACAPKKNRIIGKYKSTCILHLYPSVILTIDSASQFEYQFAYLKEKIKGNWVIKKDTLFLYAEIFKKQIADPLEPIHKNTDLKEMDAYLIRRNKLLKLSINGVDKSCYLEKQNIKQE